MVQVLCSRYFFLAQLQQGTQGCNHQLGFCGLSDNTHGHLCFLQCAPAAVIADASTMPAATFPADASMLFPRVLVENANAHATILDAGLRSKNLNSPLSTKAQLQIIL